MEKIILAFSIRYVPGIYINDHKRFAGPVRPDQIESLIPEIIKQFNDNKETRQNGLSAMPYRGKYKQSRCDALLPDIWIDHPDTYFFEQHGKFIEPNKNFRPIESLEHVDRDMFTGIKGRYPLLCVDSFLANFVKDKDPKDLTLAYKLIVRGMGM